MKQLFRGVLILIISSFLFIPMVNADGECSLQFDMNGGSALEGYDIACGSTATLPRVEDVTAPNGKILDGWSDGKDTYHPGEEVEINGEVTFSAIWANAYTVTFDLNGKQSLPIEPKVVKEGGYVMPPEEPKSHGFVFTGWYTESGCENLFEFETETINSNTTIYAGWAQDENIYDIRIESTTNKVYEGLLPEFTVSTTTEHIEIDPYGSNTTWMKWENGQSSWHGFGGEEKVAVSDNTTHYAMRLQINLRDEKKFSDDVKIYFNGVDVTNTGHTQLDSGFSWGGYVYIDLGVAEQKDVVKPTLSITSNNNKVTLSWENQSVVEKTEIYRSLDNKKWTKLSTETTNTYTDKSLTYGKTYYYKVRVYGNKKWSKYSGVVSKKIVPNKVKKLKIKSANTNTIKLEWDKVSVSGYVVYRSLDNKTWTKVLKINKSTTVYYDDVKLKSNKRYYYKVRAYKVVSGKNIYGKYSDVVNTKTAPEKPVVSLKPYNSESLKFSLEASKGAKYYLGELAFNSDFKEKVSGRFDTVGSEIWNSLPIGKTIYIRVKACNAEDRCSKWSVASAKVVPSTPKLSLSSTKTKTVNVKTTIIHERIDGFKIYRSTSKNGKYELIKTINQETDPSEYTLYTNDNNGSISFNDKTKKGKTYYYKVRTYALDENNKKVYSSYSKIKSITSK